MTTVHTPVLRDEVLTALNPLPGHIIIDATLGGGGHAGALLQRITPGGLLLGFDQDATAIARIHERFDHQYGPAQLIVIHAHFSELKQYCQHYDLVGRINGIVFDLGISSDQLEQSGRGFSFRADQEPLDLRMDARRPTDGATLLNTADLNSLTRYFREYGEIRLARPLARAVEQVRQERPIRTVADFKQVIQSVYPRLTSDRLAPIWQAIRIAVNHELEEIAVVLNDAFSMLSSGGRLAVITFHSLEDRIVKHQFKALADTQCHCPPEFPVCVCQSKPSGRLLTTKPVRPTAAECGTNPRARSAKLRTIIKY